MQDQARDDSNTAIKWLKGDSHNLLVAHLVRALILADDEQPRAAIEHFRKALGLCGQLAEEYHRRDQAAEEEKYRRWQTECDTRMKQLRFKSADEELPDEQISSPPPELPAEGVRAPIPLPEPTQLIWPSKPLKAKFKPADTLGAFQPGTDQRSKARVWVDGRIYQVESLEGSTSEVQFVPGQTYTVVEVEDKPDQPRRYLLVRQQSRPGEPGRYVVVYDAPPADRQWNHESATADTIAWVIGPSENSEPAGTILGVVEAILLPTPAPELPAADLPSSTHRRAQDNLVDDIDEDLLTCVDTLSYALQQAPDDAGLTATYQKFQSFLKQRLGLDVIEITPNTTLFDERLGHYADAVVHQQNLPDNVIVQVTKLGYRRGGRIVRDPHVIVNKLSGSE